MRITPWIVVVTLLTSPAYAADLHGVSNAARSQRSTAVPRSPSTYQRGHEHVRLPRLPWRWSDDEDSLGPHFGRSLLWPISTILYLEPSGPPTFIYERWPYAHHSKGIVRTKPVHLRLLPEELQLSNAERREDTDTTGPLVDAEVYFHGSQTENDRRTGEHVARLDIEDDTGAPLDEPEIQLDTDYPPMPPPVGDSTDWRDGGHSWAAQIQADAAFIDSNTWRVRPRFRVFTPSRFELDGEFALYREHLSPQDASRLGRATNWLGTSTAHIALRFSQSQAVQFRFGVGPRLITTPDDTLLGLDSIYGFDAFIHNPLVLSGSVGLGVIGQGAFVSDLRIQLGVVVQGIEAYAGWERLGVDATSLSGPVVGLRYWF